MKYGKERQSPHNITATKRQITACITWPKKSGLGEAAWKAACENERLPPKKIPPAVPTRFASTVLLFKNALAYRLAIYNCFNKQKDPDLAARVPTALMWETAQAVVYTLEPVVKLCVLNQGSGNWRLSDAVHTALRLVTDLQKPE